MKSTPSKNINTLLYIGLFTFALFIACAFMIEDYLSMFIIGIFGLILIFYVQNRFNLRDRLHNSQWF